MLRNDVEPPGLPGRKSSPDRHLKSSATAKEAEPARMGTERRPGPTMPIVKSRYAPIRGGGEDDEEHPNVHVNPRVAQLVRGRPLPCQKNR
jgi:hypothetical protein